MATQTLTSELSIQNYYWASNLHLGISDTQKKHCMHFSWTPNWPPPAHGENSVRKGYRSMDATIRDPRRLELKERPGQPTAFCKTLWLTTRETFKCVWTYGEQKTTEKQRRAEQTTNRKKSTSNLKQSSPSIIADQIVAIYYTLFLHECLIIIHPWSKVPLYFNSCTFRASPPVNFFDIKLSNW